MGRTNFPSLHPRSRLTRSSYLASRCCHRPCRPWLPAANPPMCPPSPMAHRILSAQLCQGSSRLDRSTLLSHQHRHMSPNQVEDIPWWSIQQNSSVSHSSSIPPHRFPLQRSLVLGHSDFAQYQTQIDRCSPSHQVSPGDCPEVQAVPLPKLPVVE